MEGEREKKLQILSGCTRLLRERERKKKDAVSIEEVVNASVEEMIAICV